MPKNKSKPDWQLTFTINSEPKLAMDGQVMHKATALAKRGDFAYMAELELVNWSEDIAAFFEKVRSVFFDAEVNGLPEFPVVAEDQRSDNIEGSIPASEIEKQSLEAAANEDSEYEITLYEADGDIEQSTLF